MTPLASSISECADGAAALPAYLAERPDVVLMDVCMSTVDGIEATGRIRTADSRARVLMVTNYDDEGLRQASMRAGATGYVLKQNLLELVDLLEAIDKSIKGSEENEDWNVR